MLCTYYESILASLAAPIFLHSRSFAVAVSLLSPPPSCLISESALGGSWITRVSKRASDLVRDSEPKPDTTSLREEGHMHRSTAIWWCSL